MSNVIADQIVELERLLTEGGLEVSGRTPNDAKNRAVVRWSGVLNSSVAFTIDIITPQWRDVGDLFVKAWNIIAASPNFSGQVEQTTVSYNEIPIDSKKRANMVSIVVTGRGIDARGI